MYFYFREGRVLVLSIDLSKVSINIKDISDDTKRGFEVCSGGVEFDCKLPTRSTTHSAGYDFYAPYDVVIPSLWKQVGKYLLHSLLHFSFNSYKEAIKPTMIKTYIKSYMGDDEVLYIYNRSSSPIKKGLVLSNGVGVVDGDFYNNEDNEGNIGVAFYNFYPFDVTITKGDRVCQGVFSKFLKATNDNVLNNTRSGGCGSTGK